MKNQGKSLKNDIFFNLKRRNWNHPGDLVKQKSAQIETTQASRDCVQQFLNFSFFDPKWPKFKNEQNLMFKVPLWAEKSLHAISKASA